MQAGCDSIQEYAVLLLWQTASNIVGHLICQQHRSDNSPILTCLLFIFSTAKALWYHDEESRGTRPAFVVAVLHATYNGKT